MLETPLTTLRRSPVRVWAGRLSGIVFGVLFAWLLAEVLLRLFFFSLPPRLQLVLNHVHKTPFTESKLLPDPIWQSDREYLTITRPVRDHEQFGSAEVRFTVTTESLWGSRAAFRTRQELVDQHVDAVAVGDSFTFCFTDEDDCWVQRLGSADRIGISSTWASPARASVSHQRVLSTFGMPLQPPLVIWQWFGNDANEDYGLAKLNGVTDVQSTNPPPSVPKYNWWDKNSAFYVLLKLYLGSEDEYDASLQFHDPEYAEQGDIKLAFGQPYLWDAFDMAQPTNQDGWARSQEAFRAARDMVEELRRHPADRADADQRAGLPQHERTLTRRGQARPAGQSPIHLMKDFCAQENLTCLDLLPILQDYADDEQIYYTTDMHLNARGNAILAETLAGWIDEHPEVFQVGD